MKQGFVQNRTVSSNGYCQGKKKKKRRARGLGRKEKIIFLTLALDIRKETLLTG